jgi:hypothetical protein
MQDFQFLKMDALETNQFSRAIWWEFFGTHFTSWRISGIST